MHSEKVVLRPEVVPGTRERSFELRPTRPCRPFAVLVWGASHDSFIEQLCIGHRNELVQRVAALPFEAEIPFEEFESIVQRREGDYDFLPLRALEWIGQFHWLMLSTVELGWQLQLVVTGPFEHAVLLADMLRAEPRAIREG